MKEDPSSLPVIGSEKLASEQNNSAVVEGWFFHVETDGRRKQKKAVGRRRRRTGGPLDHYTAERLRKFSPVVVMLGKGCLGPCAHKKQPQFGYKNEQSKRFTGSSGPLLKTSTEILPPSSPVMPLACPRACPDAPHLQAALAVARRVLRGDDMAAGCPATANTRLCAVLRDDVCTRACVTDCNQAWCWVLKKGDTLAEMQKPQTST